MTQDQIDLTDIYRTFHRKVTEYTFFSSAHKHSPGYITSWVTNQASENVRKLKLYQASILTTMLWDWKSITGKKTVRNKNTWRLNSVLLNNQEISEEIKEETKKYIETNDNKNTKTQNLWDEAKAVLRGKFTAIQSHLKKQEKSQINNLMLHLITRERRTKRTQSQ